MFHNGAYQRSPLYLVTGPEYMILSAKELYQHQQLYERSTHKHLPGDVREYVVLC